MVLFLCAAHSHTFLFDWNGFAIPQKVQKRLYTFKVKGEAEKMDSTTRINESGSHPLGFLKALKEVGRIVYSRP